MNIRHLSQTILATALLSLSGCIVVNNERVANHPTPKRGISPTLGGKLFTSAWIQRSAEYQALCIQAYSLATERLEANLRHKTDKPWAIVTDIDETILDNSPNSVYQALRGEDYTDKSWDEWCERAEAVPLAGSLEFFKRADQAGVRIFYISNRNEANRRGTIANLRRWGYPQAEDANLLLRTTTSDKTERRASVLSKYNIMMLLGDNLGDFDHVFDSSNESVRLDGLKAYYQEFGRRFIVLPNPNYGTWEKAMNGGYPALEEKDKKLMKSLLKSY